MERKKEGGVMNLTAYINGYKEDVIGADDGTNILVKFANSKLYRIRKADGQMQIEGGYDSDTSI